MLRIFQDRAHGPRVEVAFGSLPAGTEYLTVVRTCKGEASPVRGALRIRVAGVSKPTDYEVPFDVESTYHGVAYSASGVKIAETGKSSITVASEHADFARIHNPLDPSTSVLVRFESSAVSKRSRHFGGEVLYPIGRGVGVAVTTGRSGYKGLALDLIAETIEQSQRIDALFGDQRRKRLPILCVRVPQSHYRMRLPPVLFVAVLNPDEEPFATDDASIWRVTGEEVSPPAPALVVPLLSRDDLDVEYATRNAMDAAHLTRYDMSTRYDLAGGAG